MVKTAVQRTSFGQRFATGLADATTEYAGLENRRSAAPSIKAILNQYDPSGNLAGMVSDSGTISPALKEILTFQIGLAKANRPRGSGGDWLAKLLAGDTLTRNRDSDKRAGELETQLRVDSIKAGSSVYGDPKSNEDTAMALNIAKNYGLNQNQMQNMDSSDRTGFYKNAMLGNQSYNDPNGNFQGFGESPYTAGIGLQYQPLPQRSPTQVLGSPSGGGMGASRWQ